jgi:ubiquitin conjugation factor E4 B
MIFVKRFYQLVRNYNLRAKLGDVLHDIFLPRNSDRHSEVPDSITCDPLARGQPYLTSDRMSKETLAPSLLLLYGEVENTGYYEKNDHRTKIAALLKFLWDSPDHKAAFKGITEDKNSFITFANGIVNEMNSKFADVMEALPSIRTAQVQMANPQEWAALSEEERETITARHESNEQQVKHVLPLCNSVMKMLGFLNTDKDIRDMFLLPDMCPRLANMLLHVLNKLVGSRGLDLKVDNPESYNFRPKEMLQDLCVVFSSFAAADEFQIECARSGYYTSDLMSKSVKTCRKLGLLVGESMELFDLLAAKVEVASQTLISDEDLYEDAPEEFLDPLMQEFMTDPVLLPTSNSVVDRRTITQHLLNNDTDPFNRKHLSIEDVVPAIELKEKMKLWLESKRAARDQAR